MDSVTLAGIIQWPQHKHLVSRTALLAFPKGGLEGRLQFSGEPGSQIEGTVWMVGVSLQAAMGSPCLWRDGVPVTSVPYRPTLTSPTATTTSSFTESDPGWWVFGNCLYYLNALWVWHQVKNKTRSQTDRD